MIQHLNRNQIYLVSDSVFSTFHCFAIRTSPIRAIYLAVENAEELGSWVTLLKIFAQPNVSGCVNGAEADVDSFLYRLERTLYLRVYEGKNISGGSRESSSELYCEISVEDEVLAITGMQRKTSSPGWKEDFSLRYNLRICKVHAILNSEIIYVPL
jgi:C2 domain